MLRSLCLALGLPFHPAMLSWPAGPKPCDGVWAPWWYATTHKATGFSGEGVTPVENDASGEGLLHLCHPQFALRFSTGHSGAIARSPKASFRGVSGFIPVRAWGLSEESLDWASCMKRASRMTKPSTSLQSSQAAGTFSCLWGHPKEPERETWG